MSDGSKDIYGRRPRSDSHGRTAPRILALQHAADVLPGAAELLADAPRGSIGEGIQGFLVDWVAHRPVTSRRAYERGLVLLARDLTANGPQLAAPAGSLDTARFAQHLAWRVDNGLDHPLELVRAGVHLTRFADWLNEHRDCAIATSREELREHARSLLDELGTYPTDELDAIDD